MRQCGAVGIHYRRAAVAAPAGTARDPRRSGQPGLRPDGPDRLWVMDVTEHPTGEGKVYLAVVLDACQPPGRGLVDRRSHARRARRRRPRRWPPGGASHPRARPIAHSDHGGAIHVLGVRHAASAAPGCSARWAPSATASTTAVAEASSPALQRELLDQHHWTSRAQLATAIFDWIECWYNPHRRHCYCDGLSPIDYETANAA